MNSFYDLIIFFLRIVYSFFIRLIRRILGGKYLLKRIGLVGKKMLWRIFFLINGVVLEMYDGSKFRIFVMFIFFFWLLRIKGVYGGGRAEVVVYGYLGWLCGDFCVLVKIFSLFGVYAVFVCFRCVCLFVLIKDGIC